MVVPMVMVRIESISRVLYSTYLLCMKRDTPIRNSRTGKAVVGALFALCPYYSANRNIVSFIAANLPLRDNLRVPTF